MSQDCSEMQLSDKLTIIEQRQRLMYLGLVLFPLVMSLAHRWGIHLSLWGCPLVKWIGVPCMGWGLTRSFYATARGDFFAAANFHLFGPVLFLGFAIATLHWTLELCKGRKIKALYSPWTNRSRFWLFSFLIILGYHLTRLASLQTSGQLQQWFGGSIVGQWF
jgi:hypothetical protein